MSLHGSTLSHSIRADRRGTLATVNDRALIVAESIKAIIETRQGERKMLPDYGIPDFVFSVMDAGFTARIAFFLARQVKRYEPMVDKIRVRIGVQSDDQYALGFTADQQRAVLVVEFTLRGSNTPQTLVWPTWRLRLDA
jgi:phage baseplate assembly protein W